MIEKTFKENTIALGENKFLDAIKHIKDHLISFLQKPKEIQRQTITYQEYPEQNRDTTMQEINDIATETVKIIIKNIEGPLDKGEKITRENKMKIITQLSIVVNRYAQITANNRDNNKIQIQKTIKKSLEDVFGKTEGYIEEMIGTNTNQETIYKGIISQAMSMRGLKKQEKNNYKLIVPNSEQEISFFDTGKQTDFLLINHTGAHLIDVISFKSKKNRTNNYFKDQEPIEILSNETLKRDKEKEEKLQNKINQITHNKNTPIFHYTMYIPQSLQKQIIAEQLSPEQIQKKFHEALEKGLIKKKI